VIFTTNGALAVPVSLQAAGAAPVFGAGTTGDAFNRVELRANGQVALGTGAATPDTTFQRGGLGVTQFNGKLSIANNVLDIITAGNGLMVAEGANAKQGIATLVAGTVVVANTAVTANSRIMLTCQSLGTVVAPSALCVSARTPGTSFTILASQNTDTSVIAYEIFEPG
jgi:hypothetical protein